MSNLFKILAMILLGLITEAFVFGLIVLLAYILEAL
jgi:hypothetical protein